MRKSSTSTTIFSFVLFSVIVLIIAGLLVIVNHFTLGFTTDFQYFYVMKSGVEYFETGEVDLLYNKVERFDVYYTLDFLSSNQAKEFTVKLSPATDFKYYVDDELYSFSTVDLSSVSDVNMYSGYFTIKLNYDIPDILSILNQDKTVEFDDDYNSEAYNLKLTITSSDKKQSVTVKFRLKQGVSNGHKNY